MSLCLLIAGGVLKQSASENKAAAIFFFFLKKTPRNFIKDELLWLCVEKERREGIIFLLQFFQSPCHVELQLRGDEGDYRDDDKRKEDAADDKDVVR